MKKPSKNERTVGYGSHLVNVKKVTPKVLIKEALKKTNGQYLSFVMGEDFELESASWFGLQIVELFDVKHLVLGHFGGGVLETVCIEEDDTEQIIEEMKEAVALLQKDEGNAIWMEV